MCIVGHCFIICHGGSCFFTRPGGSYVNILVVVHIHVFSIFFSCSWRFGFFNRFMVFPCAWWFMWFSCFYVMFTCSCCKSCPCCFPRVHGGSCFPWSWRFMLFMVMVVHVFDMFLHVHSSSWFLPWWLFCHVHDSVS
jgi:hypothetical protein